jgi:hypothetical protein
MRNGIFQGQMDSGLIYWPNHSRKVQLSKQDKEGEAPKFEQALNLKKYSKYDIFLFYHGICRTVNFSIFNNMNGKACFSEL